MFDQIQNTQSSFHKQQNITSHNVMERAAINLEWEKKVWRLSENQDIRFKYNLKISYISSFTNTLNQQYNVS